MKISQLKEKNENKKKLKLKNTQKPKESKSTHLESQSDWEKSGCVLEAPAQPPSSTTQGAAPGAPRPAPRGPGLGLTTPHQDRNVESHQVGPEPHLNVIHDRGLHHGDLQRRQAAARQPPARQGDRTADTSVQAARGNQRHTERTRGAGGQQPREAAGREAAALSRAAAGWARGGGIVRVLQWITF